MSEAVASTTASLTKLRASLDLLHGVVARIDTAQQQMRAQLNNQALAVQESARLHDATARALAKLTERLDAVGRVCPASGQHRLAYDAQEVHGGRRQPHMNRAGTQIPYAVVESTHGVAAAAFPAPLLPTDRIVAAGVPEIVLHLGAPKVFEEIPTKTSAAAVVTKAASAPTALLLTDQVVVVDALQGEYNQVAFTPTRCLTQGLAVCADVQLAAVTREATLCPSPTAAVLDGELKYYAEPLSNDDYDDVFTQVGGMSLFVELGSDSTADKFGEDRFEDISCNKELADTVLTNVGDWSLFIEHVRITCPEFQDSCYSNNAFGHGIGLTKLLLSTGCTQGCSNIGSISVSGSTTSNLSQIVMEAPPAQLVLTLQNASFSLVEPLLASRLRSSWDPGGSRYTCWVLNNIYFAGTIKNSFMNLLLDLNVGEDSKSRILPIELCFQWVAGIMLNALIDAMSVTEVPDGRTLESRLHDYGCSESKLHVPRFELICPSKHLLMPWDSGEIHTNVSCASPVPLIRVVGLSRPWDPGVVKMHGWAALTISRPNNLPASWSCMLLRYEQAIAWGQAMFFGGGNVMTLLEKCRAMLGTWAFGGHGPWSRESGLRLGLVPLRGSRSNEGRHGTDMS